MDSGTVIICRCSQDGIFLAADTLIKRGEAYETDCKIHRLSEDNYFVCGGLCGVPGFDAVQAILELYRPGVPLSELAEVFHSVAGPRWFDGFLYAVNTPGVTVPSTIMEAFFVGRSGKTLSAYQRGVQARKGSWGWELDSYRLDVKGEIGGTIGFGLRSARANELLESRAGVISLEDAVVEAIGIEAESNQDVGLPVDILHLDFNGSRIDRYGGLGQKVTLLRSESGSPP